MTASNVITTSSVGTGIADVQEDFILEEKPMSRLVFRAQIHDKGIRGKIIRQRRATNDDVWIADQSVHIRSLEKGESINFDINTSAVRELYAAISKLENILNKKGVAYGKKSYAVVDPNSVVITDGNKAAYINKILEAGYEEDVWKSLVELNSNLVTKLSYAKIQIERKRIVQELEDRLKRGGFSETSGDDSWQRWIYRNNWLFGVNYNEPIEKVKINITGIMPDYIFPTLDGFVDILEIKLPEDPVIIKDSSHKGSWKWTAETNASIGQVVNYLGEIDRLRFEIENSIKTSTARMVSLLKPRAYILIGESTLWERDKIDGLKKLNHALHGIEVLTYRDLMARGNQAININH